MTFRNFRIIFIALFLQFTALTAGTPPDTVKHRQENRKPALVLMNCSAHPDDEDGGTLAYYQHLKGVRTFSIFYTRGEGGQNETGPELGRDLGVLRTRETLRAARILGTQAYFLDFPDFGFSKTATETFSRWRGRDRVLARIVYYIRALKPDIIITNHDTMTVGPNRQHGNHQAVGITVTEAFDSAASPTYHREQIRGSVTVWQVKKLYYRVFRPAPDARDSLVTINMGAAASNGTTIEQITLDALAQHRTQGMDKIAVAAIPQRYRERHYRLVRSDRSYPYDPADLFSGVSPSTRTITTIHSPIDTIPRPAQRDGLPDKSVSAKTASGIFIGLVNTYDNTTEEILKRFNIRYRLIDSAFLSSGRLDDFSTIILDLRAYFFRHELPAANERILQYVRNGGNVLCMYHKTGDWNGKNYPPLPLTLTDERVTEETAPVTVIEPAHPFFSRPNTIGPADWNRWIQERSLYLPSSDTAKTSSLYHRLLAMSDTGEQEPPTSLLWLEWGRGTYTYVSLALYRQLKILNEGGVKLFLNMIAQQHR